MHVPKNWCNGKRVKKLGIWKEREQDPGEQIRTRPILATATYYPSCPGMQGDTRVIHLPSPATRDAFFFVRVHGAAFHREEANNGCGPVLIKSWRLSLYPTTRCLKAASSFCQSRPPLLLQKTLRVCEATASHDVDEQCIRGSWGQHAIGEALKG
jgi:hypothetical protein